MAASNSRRRACSSTGFENRRTGSGLEIAAGRHRSTDNGAPVPIIPAGESSTAAARGSGTTTLGLLKRQEAYAHLKEVPPRKASVPRPPSPYLRSRSRPPGAAAAHLSADHQDDRDSSSLGRSRSRSRGGRSNARKAVPRPPSPYRSRSRPPGAGHLSADHQDDRDSPFPSRSRSRSRGGRSNARKAVPRPPSPYRSRSPPPAAGHLNADHQATAPHLRTSEVPPRSPSPYRSRSRPPGGGHLNVDHQDDKDSPFPSRGRSQSNSVRPHARNTIMSPSPSTLTLKAFLEPPTQATPSLEPDDTANSSQSRPSVPIVAPGTATGPVPPVCGTGHLKQVRHEDRRVPPSRSRGSPGPLRAGGRRGGHLRSHTISSGEGADLLGPPRVPVAAAGHVQSRPRPLPRSRPRPVSQTPPPILPVAGVVGAGLSRRSANRARHTRSHTHTIFASKEILEDENLPRTFNLKNPTLVGFLRKRGVKAFKRNWKIRFCVIHERCLYWLKSQQDDFPLGRIYLAEPHLEINELHDQKSFEIVNARKTIEFQASNYNELQSWLQHLRKAQIMMDIVVRKSFDDRVDASSSTSRDEPPPPPTTSMKLGRDDSASNEQNAKMIKLLVHGARFMRYNRKGHLKFDSVRLSDDLTRVYYGERGHFLPTADLLVVRLGRSGVGFRKFDQFSTNQKAAEDRALVADRCFTVSFKNATLDLQAITPHQKNNWIAAFEWLRMMVVEKIAAGLPFNVKHRSHVDLDFNWTGDNLENVFAITGLLGSGAFGEVYLAEHRDSRAQIAIKMIEVENLEVAEDIRKEIEILKRCKNDSIVSYYGCWGPDRQNRLWILMQYCHVGSARKLITTTSELTEPEIAFICAQTLLALVYLHGNHIIHRDVKGENIMLTEDGHVKLADFGVSEHLGYRDPSASVSSSRSTSPVPSTTPSPATSRPASRNDNDGATAGAAAAAAAHARGSVPPAMPSHLQKSVNQNDKNRTPSAPPLSPHHRTFSPKRKNLKNDWAPTFQQDAKQQPLAVFEQHLYTRPHRLSDPIISPHAAASRPPRPVLVSGKSDPNLLSGKSRIKRGPVSMPRPSRRPRPKAAPVSLPRPKSKRGAKAKGGAAPQSPDLSKIANTKSTNRKLSYSNPSSDNRKRSSSAKAARSHVQARLNSHAQGSSTQTTRPRQGGGRRTSASRREGKTSPSAGPSSHSGGGGGNDLNASPSAPPMSSSKSPRARVSLHRNGKSPVRDSRSSIPEPPAHEPPPLGIGLDMKTVNEKLERHRKQKQEKTAKMVANEPNEGEQKTAAAGSAGAQNTVKFSDGEAKEQPPVAKKKKKERKEIHVVGSPLWMAPEVMDGEGSHKSDIWSLGIVAIEISEGRLPHSKMRIPSHIIQMIQMSPPPSLQEDHWSPEFKDFVKQCLVKDAVQRKDALQMLSHPFVLNAHNPEVIAKRVKDSIDAKNKTPSKTDKLAKMAAAKTSKFVNKLRQKRAGLPNTPRSNANKKRAASDDDDNASNKKGADKSPLKSPRSKGAGGANDVTSIYGTMQTMFLNPDPNPTNLTMQMFGGGGADDFDASSSMILNPAASSLKANAFCTMVSIADVPTYDTMKTIQLSPEPLQRTNEDDEDGDDEDEVPSFLKTDPVFLTDDDPPPPPPPSSSSSSGRRTSKPPVRVASPLPRVMASPGVAEQLDLVAMLESSAEQRAEQQASSSSMSPHPRSSFDKPRTPSFEAPKLPPLSVRGNPPITLHGLKRANSPTHRDRDAGAHSPSHAAHHGHGGFTFTSNSISQITSSPPTPSLSSSQASSQSSLSSASMSSSDSRSRGSSSRTHAASPLVLPSSPPSPPPPPPLEESPPAAAVSRKSSSSSGRPPRAAPPERVRTKTVRPKKPPRPQSPQQRSSGSTRSPQSPRIATATETASETTTLDVVATRPRSPRNVHVNLPHKSPRKKQPKTTSPKASSPLSTHSATNSRQNPSPRAERSPSSNSQPPQSSGGANTPPSRRSASRPAMSSPRPRQRQRQQPRPRKALSPKPRRLKHSARQVYHKLTRSSTHTPPNINEALTQAASPLPDNPYVGGSHALPSHTNSHQSSADDAGSLYHVPPGPKPGYRGPTPSLAAPNGVVRVGKVADVRRKYTYYWKATPSPEAERRLSRVDWPSSDSIRGLRKSCADKEPRVLDMIELYEHLQGSRSDLGVDEDPPPPEAV